MKFTDNQTKVIMKKSFSVFRLGIQPPLRRVSKDHKTEKSADAWIDSQSDGTYVILPTRTKLKAVRLAAKKITKKAAAKKKTVKKVAPKAKRKVKKRT